MKYRRNGDINDIKHVLCRRTGRYIQARVVGACFVTRDEKWPFFDDSALIKSPEI